MVARAAIASLAPTDHRHPVAAASDRAGASDASDGVKVERRLRYGGSGRTVLDVYRRRRRGGSSAPAVLVVHGGGWRFGDKGRMEGVSRALAQAGFVAFNVNYSLAAWWRPGFPTQLYELRAAIRWIRRNAERFGLDRDRIGALGSSAGGHLAALLAVSARGSLSAGTRVRAVATWSAPFDLVRPYNVALAPAIETFLGCSLHRCPQRGSAASPVVHVSADDPPFLIESSEQDLVPVEHAGEMAAELASVGVPHALWVLPGDQHGTDYTASALGRSINFLRRRLG